jgi:hypothetical protein
MLTLEGTASLTSRAGAACLRKRPDDMIPDTELCHVWANISDDTRNLVAENRWYRNDIVRGEQ